MHSIKHLEALEKLEADLEASNPSLERTFQGHTGPINSLSFSSNNKQIASGSQDCTIHIWNLGPQMRAFKFVGHKVFLLFLKERKKNRKKKPKIST